MPPAKRSARLTSDQILGQIVQKIGRPLRVLHLGNVANYAYVNAKMMRAMGIVADVLDPDFYHIMATPEWQDGDFQATFADQFKPIWRKIDLNGFERPDWFVQGPLLPALRQLSAQQGEATPLKSWGARFDMALSRRRALDDFSGPLSRFFIASGHPFARLVRAPLTLVQRFAKKVATPSLLQTPDLPAGFPAGATFDADTRALIAHVLSYYDVVHSYTISGHLAAQAGLRNYIACELGTLRGLPFEASPMGELTAWLYRDAPEVMITNPDCIPAAKKLGIARQRTTTVLHPYDIAAADAVLGGAYTPPPLDGLPLFFAPARHHWRDGNASWLKGNHIYLEALGRLAQEGHAFKLVTVDWGAETDQSRALIDTLGLTSHTTWIEPAPRKALWQWYQKAAAVFDQFNAQSFGGAALDAMAVGRRLITRFDAKAIAPFFHEAPPLSSAASIEEVLVAARGAVLDPTDQDGNGHKLYHWVRANHGQERQLSDQLQVYQRLMADDASSDLLARHNPA